MREVCGGDAQNTPTFDSREVDAGVLVNPNAVADNPERALFECARARHQLEAAKQEKNRDIKTWFLFSFYRGDIKIVFRLFTASEQAVEWVRTVRGRGFSRCVWYIKAESARLQKCEQILYFEAE